MTCASKRSLPALLNNSNHSDNGTEYCGAGQRLNVYQLNSTAPTSSLTSSSATGTTTSGISTTGTIASGTATSSTTTGSATRSSASPTGPQISQTVGNYTFQGCWTEATTGRALASKTYANDSMTLESCSEFCTGYTMFGVEYGRECKFLWSFANISTHISRLLRQCAPSWQRESNQSGGLQLPLPRRPNHILWRGVKTSTLPTNIHINIEHVRVDYRPLEHSYISGTIWSNHRS